MGKDSGRSKRKTGQKPAKDEKRQPSRGLAAAAVAGIGAAAASAPAQAAVFNVTNLNDAGAGSLRQAIVDANGAAGADTITFQAGLSGTITLTGGQLYITDSVDIQGPGAAMLSVSGNNASRVFYLYNGSATLDVTISGLTITGGTSNIGAGVVNFDENLLLDQVTISGNTSTGDGAGLWADGFNMNLTVRDSVISGNVSGDDGGGIYIEDTGGPLLIQRTTISGNTASGSGGGIYFYDPDDDVTLEDSTISGNQAGSLGGGVYLYSPDAGQVTFRGTTVSGNMAPAGGGLFLYSPDHGGQIQNSTISGNQATAGSGGGIYLYNLYNFALHHVTVANNSASGSGGGVYMSNGTLPVDNLIAGDNTAGSDNDVSGSFAVADSLIEDPGTAAITDNGGNVFNQDPMLGTLQNNGGSTLTHLPAFASPAVDAGSSAFVVDQRGQARPVGGAVDMGAVEVNPGIIELTVSAVNVNEAVGTVTVTATRTGGSDGAVSVSYASAPGTATSPDDFADAMGMLNWGNQDNASKSFQVTIVDDNLDEGNEQLTAAISNPTGGAALGATTVQTITILDDDTAGSIQLTASTVDVDEGAGTVTITATRTGGMDGAVSVSFATAPGTAISPDDFADAMGTLDWADQDGASKSFQVSIVDDMLVDGNEMFTATISGPTGNAVLGSPATIEVTILDNDAVATIEVPTLGEWARILFCTLLAAAGALLLQRRRRLAGPMLALMLTAGPIAKSTSAAVERPGAKSEVEATLVLPRSASAATVDGLLASSSRLPAGTMLRFADGSVLALDGLDVETKVPTRPRDLRLAAAAATASSKTQLPSRVVIRRGADGDIKRVIVKLGTSDESKR